MRIELDIFSGRPNPSWALSPAEAGELMARLQELPSGDSPQPRLGFRGFVVHRLDAGGTSRPWLRIGGGAVRVLTSAGGACYRDTEGIEAWLVELATRAGFGALLASARGEQ